MVDIKSLYEELLNIYSKPFECKLMGTVSFKTNEQYAIDKLKMLTAEFKVKPTIANIHDIIESSNNPNKVDRLCNKIILKSWGECDEN